MAEGFAFTAAGLTVGYDGKPLIRRISFHLRSGEILALIGPNGGGKTTILRTISGQLAAQAGTVWLGKDELSGLRAKELAKRLSVMLTGRIQPELMTCYDVAAAGRYPYTGRLGVLGSEDHAVVQRCLAQVHALEIAERDFARVSDGQRQRVLLARALCQEPEILVLDEPTSYLDVHHRTELLSILRRMAREQGLAVVLSLHEIDLAQKVADRVMCVKGETIASSGKPEEVLTAENIEALYDLRPGSCDARSGSAELEPPEGEPRVFVLGGGGFGAPHYRRLQRRGIPFDTGILFDNDVDYPVARALASHVFAEAAFGLGSSFMIEDAVNAMRACGTLLHTGVPIRAQNACCADLLRAAEMNGIRVVRDVDELD